MLRRFLRWLVGPPESGGFMFERGLESSAGYQGLRAELRDLKATVDTLHRTWMIRLLLWLSTGWGFVVGLAGTLAIIVGLATAESAIHAWLDAHGIPHPSWLP